MGPFPPACTPTGLSSLQAQLSFPFHGSPTACTGLVCTRTFCQSWASTPSMYGWGPSFCVLPDLRHILDQADGFVTQTQPVAGCSRHWLLRSHSVWTGLWLLCSWPHSPTTLSATHSTCSFMSLSDGSHPCLKPRVQYQARVWEDLAREGNSGPKPLGKGP